MKDTRTPREIRADVDEEIRAHLEMRVDALVAAGMSPEEARAEAQRRFGDLEGARAALIATDLRTEQLRRRRELLRDLAADLARAVRRVRREPVLASVIVLTLAVGIGAVTTIFSVVDHVLWRSLPVAGEERVVHIWEVDRKTGERRDSSPGNLAAWLEKQQSFEAMGLAEPSGADLTGGTRPESVSSWRVTAGFFPALGVQPLFGRLFRPDEFRGDTNVAIVSHDFWKVRLGADPAIIGRTLSLDGAATTIVGVLPPGLSYPHRRAAIWIPGDLPHRALSDTSGSYMELCARLKPGVGAAAAQEDLDRVAALVAAERPAGVYTPALLVEPLRQHVFGEVRPALLVLLGAVALVLLVGCAGVANLLLSDAARRERELAVRATLGASRGRLAWQLLSESSIYALLAGALGVFFSTLGVKIMIALGPPGMPRLDTATVDGHALAFAAGLSVLTVIVFGLLPALRAARADVAGTLRGASQGGGREQRRLRRALVSVEVALALVLLIGAGLLGRSFAALRGNDLGFTPDGVASLQLFLWDRNPSAEKRLARAAEIEAALGGVAGVEATGVVTALPFLPSQIDAQSALTVEGRSEPPRRVYTTVATDGYFEVMRIPLRAGRLFGAATAEGPRVAVVNQAFARSVFPGEDPVGKRIVVGAMDRPVSREIVGVVGDTRPTGVAADPRPELYVPLAQSGTGSVTFVVRTSGDAGALVPALRDRVAAVDAGQVVYHAAAVTDLVSATLVERRFNLAVVAGLSLVALLLATVGIYGLMTFEAGSRRREIGVRMALGARGGDVVRLIVVQGLLAVLPGVILGLAGAAALSSLLRRMLYNVAPVDPVTFAVLAAGVLATAALASFLPARRAASIDPMRVIRE